MTHAISDLPRLTLCAQIRSRISLFTVRRSPDDTLPRTYPSRHLFHSRLLCGRSSCRVLRHWFPLSLVCEAWAWRTNASNCAEPHGAIYYANRSKRMTQGRHSWAEILLGMFGSTTPDVQPACLCTRSYTTCEVNYIRLKTSPKSSERLYNGHLCQDDTLQRVLHDVPWGSLLGIAWIV